MSVQTRKKRVHILHIEDDEVVAHLVDAALRAVDSFDVNFHNVGTGDEGLAYLDNGSQVDLVVLDMNLPGIHGLDVLKAIKTNEKTRHIPVVIFSSTSNEIKQAYGLGANSYLVKPDHIDQYLQMFRSLCDFWFRFTAVPK